MANEPILPEVAHIIAPALQKFYELRPGAFVHVNLGGGVYSWPFEGWKSQIGLELNNCAQLVKNSRVATAEGDALVSLVASEFDEEPSLLPTFAMGEVTLTRGGGMPGGVIKKGTRFTRPSSSNPFTLQNADYETVADKAVLSGQATVTLPIVATSSGARFNQPLTGSSATGLQIGTTLFDSKFAVSSFTVAGGSDGLNDRDVRKLAKAAALGKFGPTKTAAVLGSLRAFGVKYFATKTDTTNGVLDLYIADSSWAASDRWCGTVKQSLYTQELVGFGCKVRCQKVVNRVVSVSCNVVLRDHHLLDDTSAYDNVIASAVREYFDDREDWYIWKSSGIKSAIIKASTDIVNASSVVVRLQDGTVLSQPAAGDPVYHYYLADNGMSITYSSPT
jgi:hypothetical protein